MSTFSPSLLSDFIQPSIGRDERPLQRQIYAAIQQAILKSQLEPGQRLPSTRSLSKDLGLSRITVALAYEQLSSEGYIVSRHGSGTFVADTRSEQVAAVANRHLELPKKGAGARNTPALSRWATEMIKTSRGVNEHEGAFVPGVPDSTHFPVHIWRRMLNRYVRKSSPELYGYNHGGGYLALRRALANYLQISRSVRCTPEQILISMGTHQSLDLCARLLANPGDVALTEEPCNWSTAAVWQAAHLRVVPIQLDHEGMRPQDYLSRVRKSSDVPKLLFTTPSHQYPMGISMTAARRFHLIELARTFGFWIIEDDYDSEFRYDSHPLPSLQGLDDHNRVIYLGTFSKVFYPGLRMSYLVAPPEITDALTVGMNYLYRSGQMVFQAAMADFIAEGYFANHIRKMRGIYAERRKILGDALESMFGDTIKISSGNAGLHLSAVFPQTANLDRMIDLATAKGISLHPLARYYGSKPTDQGFVLGFGGVKTDAILPAVKVIRRAYEQSS